MSGVGSKTAGVPSGPLILSLSSDTGKSLTGITGLDMTLIDGV